MAKRMLTVAALQASFGNDMAANIAKIERLVREAAKRGAQVDPAAGAVPGHLFPHAPGPEMVRDRVPRDASILACWRWRSSRRS